MPYAFPRDPVLLAKYAFNLLPEANLHWSALPYIAPWLYRYWRQSTPQCQAATARGARPLVERCIAEHEALMVEAGATGLMRRTGYLKALSHGGGAGGRARQGPRGPGGLWRQLPARRCARDR